MFFSFLFSISQPLTQSCSSNVNTLPTLTSQLTIPPNLPVPRKPVSSPQLLQTTLQLQEAHQARLRQMLVLQMTSSVFTTLLPLKPPTWTTAWLVVP